MKELPEGMYIVKLLDIKRHNANTYKLSVEVLEEWIGHKPYAEEQKVINGYARRYSKDFSDLSVCFENGVLHKKGSEYVGQKGLISVTSSGWISLMNRRLDPQYFSELSTTQ